MSRDLLILLTCCILVNIENVTFLTSGRFQFYKITINNVKLCGAKLNHIKWFFNKNWWRGSHSRELTYHKLFVTKLAEKSTCCAITLIVFKVYQIIWSNFITEIPKRHWLLNSHSLKKSKHLIISVNIKMKRRTDV